MLVHQRTFLATAALLLLSCQIMHGQYFSTRYSRSIGLGNAYTGVAEGIETTYSNNAGLAAIDYYAAAYSSGQGSFVIRDYDAYDIAAVVPLGPAIGTAAISYHALTIGEGSNAYFNTSLLQAHFGRAFGDALAFGASLNYYRHAENIEVRNEQNIVIFSGERIRPAVDFGLSGLYTTKKLLLPSWNDVLKAGVHINNVLGPESLHPPDEAAILQQFSFGVSYRFSPMPEQVSGRVPLTFLLATALHYENAERKRYTYDAARTSLGIELQVLELLQLRYGREDQRFLHGLDVIDSQHPVTRLGAGIVVPVGELIGAQSEYRLRLDYSHSIRHNEDALAQSMPRSSFEDFPSDTFTLQLEFRP
jgi:hypothetical protein